MPPCYHMPMKAIAGIFNNILNLAFPLHCAGCKSALDPADELGICAICMSEIKRNPNPPLRGRGEERLDFSLAYSACIYEGALKELIHTFKYKSKLSLSRILSKLMTDFIKANGGITEGIDAITFVPLQKSREKQRGFNQSKALAQNISKVSGIPLAETLQKIKKTRPQNELVKSDRLTNLGGAFDVRRGAKLDGKRILLVDDVMTTGATLNECAGTLLRAGAKEVRCFTLSRGL